MKQPVMEGGIFMAVICSKKWNAIRVEIFRGALARIKFLRASTATAQHSYKLLRELFMRNAW